MFTQFNEIQTRTQEFLVDMIDINTSIAKTAVQSVGKVAFAGFETDTYLNKVTSGIETISNYAKKAVKFEVPSFSGYSK